MKKKGFVWGLVLVLAMGLLSGCGSESAASMPQETAAAEAPVEEYSMDAAADYGTGNASMTPAAEGSETENGAVQGSKRIYTATLQLETTGFDEAVSSLTELVDSCGHNDEPCAPLRPPPVVVGELGGAVAIVGVQVVHGRHDDAVFELHAVDGDGGKQPSVSHLSSLSPGRVASQL